MLSNRRLPVAAGLLALVVLAVAALPAAALSRAQFPALARGSQGVDVLALQRLLRHAGHAAPATGNFEAATHSALVDFQAARSLAPDGVARPSTWRALVPRLQAGASGQAVLAVQELLNAKRSAGLALSGSFDSATAAAVRLFQRRVGLPRTGVLDAGTWRHLVWLFMRPQLGSNLCGYQIHGGQPPKWGTAAAISQLERAGARYRAQTGSRLAVGDISLELGGNIRGHASHEVGLDVDLRAARKDGRECRYGIAYYMRSYDRAGTRALIRAIYHAAPGRVKLIYFNDPVLVREGLVRRYPNHDAHLHVRYCEATHSKRAYRCPSAARQSESSPAATAVLEPAAGEAMPATPPPPRSFWPL